MGTIIAAAVLSLSLAEWSPPQEISTAVATPAHPALSLLGDAAIIAHADGRRIQVRVLGSEGAVTVAPELEPQERPALAVGPLGQMALAFYSPDPELPDPGTDGRWALWVVQREGAQFGSPRQLATALDTPAAQSIVWRSRGGYSLAWEAIGPGGQPGIFLAADGAGVYLTAGSDPTLVEDAAGFLVLTYLRDGRARFRSGRDDEALGSERDVPISTAVSDVDAAAAPGGGLYFLCATREGLQLALLDGSTNVEIVPGSAGATSGRLASLADGGLGVAFAQGGELRLARRAAIFAPVETLPGSAGARSFVLGAGAPTATALAAPYFVLVFDSPDGLFSSSDALAPEARFELPSLTVSQGEEVAFEDRSTGVIFERQWDFGDGTTYRGNDPRHRYSQPGTFRVTLRAQGPSGSSLFESGRRLRVIAAPYLLRFPEIAARPGDAGLLVPALLSNGEPVAGFQCAFQAETPLELTQIDVQGTRTQVLQPELLSIDIAPQEGGSVANVAALWDYLFPFDARLLPRGTDQALLLAEIAVPAGTAAGQSFALRLLPRGDPLDPANLLVSSAGESIFPHLVDGVVHLRPEEGAPFVRGDTNGDRRIDISDAIATLAYLFLGEAAPACQDAADKNDDGTIDVSDAIDLLGFLFAGGGSFPAYPYPTAGLDGTRDALPPCEHP